MATELRERELCFCGDCQDQRRELLEDLRGDIAIARILKTRLDVQTLELTCAQLERELNGETT